MVPTPKEAQIPAKYRTAQSPAEFFAIHTSTGARVLLLDRLDPNWDELLCYHYEYQKTMHIQRRGLLPVEAVGMAIDFLKQMSAH